MKALDVWTIRMAARTSVARRTRESRAGRVAVLIAAAVVEVFAKAPDGWDEMERRLGDRRADLPRPLEGGAEVYRNAPFGKRVIVGSKPERRLR